MMNNLMAMVIMGVLMAAGGASVRADSYYKEPPQFHYYPDENRGGSISRFGPVGIGIDLTVAADGSLELHFSRPTTVNEFRIKEAPSSSIVRYVIECWDDKTGRWVGCFNGLTIGPDFIAPVVRRTTTKARLLIKKTTSGVPGISEFAAYNDTTVGPLPP